tara:strand:- start:26357 stop:26596 length:240 start_codon:yes stop_codon:yes gene_type:complete
MLGIISQVIIACTGMVAIYLTQQSNDNLKKYAPILGLVGQPFWYYTTLTNGQYGIFLLTLGYTYLWGMGLYNSWFKENS